MKAAKIISYIVLVLVFVAVCGFLVYYTGGFTSDFKTFYINVDGRDILTSADGYKLSADTPLTVNVKYTFGALNKDITGYSVKVVPNAAGKDRYSEQEHKVCNKGTYERFSPVAAGAETAASRRTEQAQARNYPLRFACYAHQPVTHATHGRRTPPVCGWT